MEIQQALSHIVQVDRVKNYKYFDDIELNRCAGSDSRCNNVTFDASLSVPAPKLAPIPASGPAPTPPCPSPGA